MITSSLSRIGRHMALFAAGGLSLAFAAPAVHAQSYDESGYYQNSSDEVIIRAPRHQRFNAYGAPIENVAISRAVSFSDLDLRTGWGARELRARVYQAAYSACNEMDTAYPVAAPDEPNPDVDSCTAAAERDAMPQVHEAISFARGYSSR